MKNKYFFWLFWIGLALILIAFGFPFLVNSFFGSWATSGTFGDTYGALNAIFSGLTFAGLIVTILIQTKELKNQRKELKLQRTEMSETRKEFLLNRMTTLVYSQLERFEKAINDLKIRHEGNEYFGHNAITKLDELDKPYYSVSASEEENLESQKQDNAKQSLVHIANKIEIEKFGRTAYNAVRTLESLIYKSNFDPHELNTLKNLFFENIGFINMGVIENITELQKDQIEIFETDDYMRFDIMPGQMMRANIFLEPIVEFYKIKLSPENFNQLKQDFTSKQGANW